MKYRKFRALGTGGVYIGFWGSFRSGFISSWCKVSLNNGSRLSSWPWSASERLLGKTSIAHGSGFTVGWGPPPISAGAPGAPGAGAPCIEAEHGPLALEMPAIHLQSTPDEVYINHAEPRRPWGGFLPLDALRCEMEGSLCGAVAALLILRVFRFFQNLASTLQRRPISSVCGGDACVNHPLD